MRDGRKKPLPICGGQKLEIEIGKEGKETGREAATWKSQVLISTKETGFFFLEKQKRGRAVRYKTRHRF